MICLDTNFLILGLVPGSKEGQRLIQWLEADETLVTSTTCWYEFLCGPVTAVQIDTVRSFLRQIVPFDGEQAVVAARLFNATGRRRALRIDSMVAACAVATGAQLATDNSSDFKGFVEHGLELV